MQQSSDRPLRVAPDDLAACRKALAGGSRSFLAASLLLPRRVRDPACALYAFCRSADDEIDLLGGRLDALQRLRDRLAMAYDLRPLALPADRAFAQVVSHFAIPAALPSALLEGFEWDVCNRNYETIEDLEAYAARVAGSVGAMMALVMGHRHADMVARACELGMAMQLTNIARDVGEDARAGRLYLPLQWLREAGIDPAAFLWAPRFDAALAGVIDRLLQSAEALYRAGTCGIARLPQSCRAGIAAAAVLYREIGQEVMRCGFDSISRRAVVSTRRKAWLLAQCLVTIPEALPITRLAPPSAARFLVEAVADFPQAQPEAIGEGRQWWDFENRGIWLIGLFDRLARREWPMDAETP